MKLAVVKPDHLGDLVLSRPAIAALLQVAPDLTLFVNGRVMGLAKYLFPSAEVKEFNLPHLQKDRASALDASTAKWLLAGFEVVVFLRDDQQVRDIASVLASETFIPEGDFQTHETQIQRAAIAGLTTYGRSTSVPTAELPWPSQIATVGLCIAAGFPTNRWPELHWIELGKSLFRSNREICIFAGPAESDVADFIGRRLGLPESRVVIGGPDYASFLSEVERCDVVIGVDGGTAHLCSLVRPVLSIFGSSPWRRYSPFGRFNRTVSLDLFCGPCVQFSRRELNACLTRECMAEVTPDIVTGAMLLQDQDQSVGLRRGRCWFGVSHLAAGENFRFLDD